MGVGLCTKEQRQYCFISTAVCCLLELFLGYLPQHSPTQEHARVLLLITQRRVRDRRTVLQRLTGLPGTGGSRQGGEKEKMESVVVQRLRLTL